MDLFNFIKQEKFIALARFVPPEAMEKVAEALYNGGVRLFEIPFNPSRKNTIEETKESIKAARRAAGGKLAIGAGTVVSIDFLEAAYEAGASFIVSPNTNINIISRTKELGLLSIPGAYTPTEIQSAYDAGADIVKVFPITVNDIPYLKNIMTPLSHIPFITTGGVNQDTAAAFLEAGAIAVAAGASIVKPELVREGNYAEITRLAKMHIDSVKKSI